MEKLLNPEEKRFTLFPIRYPDIWNYYKTHESSFWRVADVDLSKDNWDELSDNEKHFIKYTLAFFSASDSIVNENLAKNFCNEVQIAEAKFFYDFQAMMENIHSEAYSLMIDTYVKNLKEKDMLFNAIDNIDCVKRKAEWALKWIESPNFVERLIAFICVEGIFFSGSFASIYWLRERQKLPGLCLFNTWISRDEGLHQEFATFLYNNYVDGKLSNERIREIIEEAVAIEKQFVTESLPVRLIGMNEESMVNYIDYVAANIYNDLGIEVSIPNNPLKFMEKIAIDKKQNFFEKRVSEYTKSDITNFNIDGNEDF